MKNRVIQEIPADAWARHAHRLTEKRRSRIEHVIANRTGHVRLVVQDVHDPHNVAACLRSAEAFGVQYIDVVNEREKFKVSESVAKGVSGWLTINHFDSIEKCASHLKERGYHLTAALPNPDAKPIGELSLEKPIAIIFGNEHEGVSSKWEQHVDSYFTIPMYGMVESLNISVSAAVAMQNLTNKARAEAPDRYPLPETIQEGILNLWISKHFSLESQ